MKQHLNFWKKVLIIFLAEVLILIPLGALVMGISGEAGRLLFLSIAFGFIGLWYRDVSGMPGLAPFILNGLLVLLASKEISIWWRVFYVILLGLILWPLALFTALLAGKQLGLLHSY